MRMGRIEVQIALCSCIFLSLCSISLATLPLDLSNLDLNKFQFFKYPQLDNNGYVRYAAPPPPGLMSVIQKARAVALYSRNLLFGKPNSNQEVIFNMDPDFGKKWAPVFQSHYGYRGENLIALLGQGHPRNKLLYHGAVSKDFRRFRK